MTDKNGSQEPKIKTSKDLDAEVNKKIALLSYVWILCLVPLLGKRDSEFAQFHAKQGLVIFIAEIVVSIFIWFPVFGQLFMLALLVISVMGIIKTLNGEWWEIPYIYELSRKVKL